MDFLAYTSIVVTFRFGMWYKLKMHVQVGSCNELMYVGFELRLQSFSMSYNLLRVEFVAGGGSSICREYKV